MDGKIFQNMLDEAKQRGGFIPVHEEWTVVGKTIYEILEHDREEDVEYLTDDEKGNEVWKVHS